MYRLFDVCLSTNFSPVTLYSYNSCDQAHNWGSKQFQIVDKTQCTVLCSVHYTLTYYTTQADSIILKERYLAYNSSINCLD